MARKDKKKAKYDSNYYLNNSQEFIPFACHINKYTILNKDGDILQTIQINGINSEKLNDKILSLRELIRQSLLKNIDTTELACWIHTVRRKRNISDNAEYFTVLSQKINDTWIRKNYWDDKFVNSLYISFVYKGANLKLDNYNSFISSFFTKQVENFHNDYVDQASIKLENIVLKIINELNDFGAERLGIYYKDGKVYSHIINFFHQIVRFEEENVELLDVNLSKSLGVYKFAVGTDVVEVNDNDESKYAAVLSIKEYQEISSKSLDKFLQQPIEMITTEIFYFVENSEAKKHTSYQDYILKISGDQKLARLKGLTIMAENEEKYQKPYCYQQISVLVLNSSLDKLESDVVKASRQLADTGLVHVREDVAIENALWSMLPGNFKYLRRLFPQTVERVASMASLHNFPTGNISGAWGKAITILRTQRGTPYFFNFHDDNQNSNCLIIGCPKMGKTILSNFVINASLKYKPKVLTISPDSSSEVFVKTQGGVWFEGLIAIDPLSLSAFRGDQDLLEEILLLAGRSNDSEYSNDELTEIKALASFLMNLGEEMHWSKISNYPFSGYAGIKIKERLKEFLFEGNYFEFLNPEPENTSFSDLFTAFNFQEFTDNEFEKNNYPEDPKYLAKYLKDLETNQKIRMILGISYIFKFLEDNYEDKKIVNIKNFNKIFNFKNDTNLLEMILSYVELNNGVNNYSLVFSPADEFFASQTWECFKNKFKTKIYMPAETIENSWQKILDLNDIEFASYLELQPTYRLFIIKQDEQSIITELSIGGLPAINKILSCDQTVINECNKFINEKGYDPSSWVLEFYDSINVKF